MQPETKQIVRQILSDFAYSQLPKFNRWTLADIRQSYPFHRLVFDDEAVRAARIERSIVTSMGSKLYPSIAEAIAREAYEEVHLEHPIEGELNDASINMIEQIVTELRTPKKQREYPREPDHEAEITDILNSRGGGRSSRTVTADLFIGDFPNGPLLIELKTPRPNLDIAAESKRKILYYLAIMDRKGIEGAQAFMGLTYNPFGSRAKYGHSYTKQIMDMRHQVLMGDEFWDFIGGPGTFNDLMEIIVEVRRQLPLP